MYYEEHINFVTGCCEYSSYLAKFHTYLESPMYVIGKNLYTRERCAGLGWVATASGSVIGLFEQIFIRTV
jgi:hypothetical protein